MAENSWFCIPVSHSWQNMRRLQQRFLMRTTATQNCLLIWSQGTWLMRWDRAVSSCIPEFTERICLDSELKVKWLFFAAVWHFTDPTHRREKSFPQMNANPERQSGIWATTGPTPALKGGYRHTMWPGEVKSSSSMDFRLLLKPCQEFLLSLNQTCHTKMLFSKVASPAVCMFNQHLNYQ